MAPAGARGHCQADHAADVGKPRADADPQQHAPQRVADDNPGQPARKGRPGADNGGRPLLRQRHSGGAGDAGERPRQRAQADHLPGLPRHDAARGRERRRRQDARDRPRPSGADPPVEEDLPQRHPDNHGQLADRRLRDDRGLVGPAPAQQGAVGPRRPAGVAGRERAAPAGHETLLRVPARARDRAAADAAARVSAPAVGDGPRLPRPDVDADPRVCALHHARLRVAAQQRGIIAQPHDRRPPGHRQESRHSQDPRGPRAPEPDGRPRERHGPGLRRHEARPHGRRV